MTFSLKRRQFGRTCAALGALVVAGSLFTSTASAQTVEELKKKGEITIGMLVDFPPYGIMNSSNEPDGYDADVARLLGKQWGVKVKLVPVTGPNRIPYLLTGKVDLLIASLAITPERAQQVQFSMPYASASIMLNAPKGSPIKAAADLKGVKVAVARASTQDVALTAVAPEGTQIKRFDDDASSVQALLSGQVDAIGCSTTVLSQIEKRAPGKYESKFALKQQYMGIVMRPGQAELLKALNEFVQKNKANGELNTLYQKWLGIGIPTMPES